MCEALQLFLSIIPNVTAEPLSVQNILFEEKKKTLSGLVVSCFENQQAQDLQNAIQKGEDNTKLTGLTL